MKVSFEILVLAIMSILLLLVNNIGGKEVNRGKKFNEKNYVRYVTSKPILSMESADIQFDGDVYFANDELPWDWNDRHQQPSQKPALYLADPFINIQRVAEQFQPMIL